MRRRAVDVTLATATVVALAMLLAALPFIPIPLWESYGLVAVLVGSIGVLGAAFLAGIAMRRLTRPMERLVRAVEGGSIERRALQTLANEAPEELAPMLHALHRAHAQLEAAMEQLERDRAQVARIVEHLADGVLVLDGNERVELSNPAAVRLLRQSRLQGRRLAEVVSDADVVQLARSATRSQPVSQIVELRRRGTAAQRWVQVIATLLPDRRRTLLLLQDVTELRRAEAARRDFVANVSHELRTPIAALKALVETLESGALEDPPAAQDFLRRMHIEVDGLTQMVSELLELARVEAGRLDLDLAPCPADDLVRTAVERIQPYAERVGLTVRQVPTSAETPPVLADARRIGQVFANLLSNALKFTSPGGSIEVGARPIDDGHQVEFWVADTGVGIRPESLGRVFERFYKTDPSRTGSGTGLGLAICKHLVQGHGGTIWAESPGEGRGATIRFTLRAVTAPELAP